MSTSNHDLNTEPSSRLELWFVKSWQSKAAWLWLLLPVSYLYALLTLLRRKLYSSSILKSYRAPVPVMIVGNITIGGSGKTPLIIELVNYLKGHNIKVGVISRGYGGDESLMPQLVTSVSKPQEVGDEPCLIVSKTSVPMAVCPDRKQAIECLIKHDPEIELIIADDGLQHYKLQRDIEWIVVDSSRGFGNKQLLPTGFLREPLSRLKEATVIYHNEYDSTQTTILNEKNRVEMTMHLVASPLKPLNTSNSLNKESVPGSNGKNKIVYAMSGIGYPQRFFNTLKSLGFEVIEKPKPDHYNFKPLDFKVLNNFPIIVTSKDAVKIKPLLMNNLDLSDLSIWELPVKTVLSQQCFVKLNRQLKAVGLHIKD